MSPTPIRSETTSRKGGLAPWQMHRLRQHVAENLDSKLRVVATAELVRLSRSHFSRAFKISFGRSFGLYVEEQRLARARELMRATDEKLSQIAILCGFADQSHFTRNFSRRVGQSPSAWRRRFIAPGITRPAALATAQMAAQG